MRMPCSAAFLRIIVTVVLQVSASLVMAVLPGLLGGGGACWPQKQGGGRGIGLLWL